MNCPKPSAAPLGPCAATCTPMDRQEFTDILAGRRFVKVRCLCAVGHCFFVEIELERQEDARPVDHVRAEPEFDLPEQTCFGCQVVIEHPKPKQRFCDKTCGRRWRKQHEARSYTPWPDARCQWFARLWNSGAPTREIEGAMGLSPRTAPGYANALRQRGVRLTPRRHGGARTGRAAVEGTAR